MTTTTKTSLFALAAFRFICAWRNVPLLGTASSVLASRHATRRLSAESCPNTLALVRLPIDSNSFSLFLFCPLQRSFFLFLKKTDLTSRPGFWGKALPERYVDVGVLFAFHFTASGDVMLNVNGQDKGVFLTGVDARTPLWIMVDIYGNTTAVQFVGKNLTPPPPILALCPSCRRIHDILLSPLFQIPEAV